MAVRNLHRIKAEREFRENLHSPSQDAKNFQPSQRVKENIQAFKKFLVDHVEMAAPKHKRPSTAALTRHSTVWGEAELRILCHQRTSSGSWQACHREIDDFSRRLDQTGERSRPSKIPLQTPVSPDATVLRYLLGYSALRKACRELPRATVMVVQQCLATPDGWDVGGRGAADLRVIRRKTFETKIDRCKLSWREVGCLYDAMDVFSDGCAAHKPFVAALRCIYTPSPDNWLAYVFTALACHNSALHVSEYLAVYRFLVDDIIGDGLKQKERESTSYIPKWQLRSESSVGEFTELREAIFTNGAQSVAWKDIRSLILERLPALTQIIVKAKL